MKSINKIKIDGDEIYIKGLDFAGGYAQDSIKDILTENSLQDALQPIIKLGQKIKCGLQGLEPDETELTLQLSVGVEGKKLFFALADASAEAQISLKYVWRGTNQAAET